MATFDGERIVPTEPVNVKPMRLMFIHYANQALNDQFESPNRNYDLPRTYVQTTMHDELGTYSSRPTSNETGVGDGYGYVLEAHEQNTLPCLFSMNGGFLSMLQQDAPKITEALKQAVAAGLIEPTIGGFAGHPDTSTSRPRQTGSAIQHGIDLIQNLLGSTGRPSTPTPACTPRCPTSTGRFAARRSDHPYRTGQGAIADRIRFVVVDQSAFDPFKDNPPLDDPNRPMWGDHRHSYIWRQRCDEHRGTSTACDNACQTWYWLIMSNKWKDSLFSASDDEWQAGKMFGDLRQHCFYGVSQPQRVADSIHVYSDDADKAAGNGWFDGDYSGGERNNAAIFAAALEWIAAHPWLQVVTTTALDPDTECLGTIDVRQGIDPYIHTDPADRELKPPFWSDEYKGDDHFDDWAEVQIGRLKELAGFEKLGFEYARWYQTWRDTPAIWLGKPFGKIAGAVEKAVTAPALRDTSNELAQLAQLAYLNCIHEAHWSKKPLEPFIPRTKFDGGNRTSLHAYERDSVMEPENFVLAQTLQMRNAHVYLCAARWADLLQAGRGDFRVEDRTYKNDGPVIRSLRERGTGAEDLHTNPEAPENSLENLSHPELRWDLDITENVILYNRQLLVVLDSNGGRITHIFAANSSGRPVVVSGNIKAYQFLGDDRTYGGTLNCNGSVLQNTVSVANHRYVASDVPQSLAQAGKRHNPKTRVIDVADGGNTWRVEDGEFGDEDWLYPDNFNEYARAADLEKDQTVAWSFPGRAWKPAQNSTSDSFDRELAEYRAWILAGAPSGQHADRKPDPGRAILYQVDPLHGSTITVSYDGNFGTGHLVANELSLDLYRMVMHGERQYREWPVAPPYDIGGGPDASGGPEPGEILGQPEGQRRCILKATGGRLQAEVSLRSGRCRFTGDTRKDAKNLRLHRAFSDCLEIESVDGSPFSYTIDVQVSK